MCGFFFVQIAKITKIQWKRETFTTHIIDALGYGDITFGERYWAIAACNAKAFIHILVHELVHNNVNEALYETCQ